jgi:pimeloyl-ACP methyl ester carboxylesterase
MGGPGEDAIGAASFYVPKLASLLTDRDLLLVDQRGTGRSAALTCRLFSPHSTADSLVDVFSPAAVDKCRRRLNRSADLTQYTYPYFARDLEEVRRALGYGQLNLFAGSYGTRAAQVYAREFRQNVRTAYLGSVVPLDADGPLYFAKTEQTALEGLIGSCENETACHRAFPNLSIELRQILTSGLASGEVRVNIPGSNSRVPLGRGRVVEWFRSKLYRPRSAADLPWVIHRAFLGDWSPIVQGILEEAREGDEDFSWGLFFAITCSEDIPFIQERDVVRETRGTFLGDYRIREQQAACKQWPKSPLESGYRERVLSSVPTLFVTGDRDGGTPLWFTDQVARGFSHHATIVMRGQGHTEWSDCIARAYEVLVRSGAVRQIESQSCPEIPLPPFKI